VDSRTAQHQEPAQRTARMLRAGPLRALNGDEASPAAGGALLDAAQRAELSDGAAEGPLATQVQRLLKELHTLLERAHREVAQVGQVAPPAEQEVQSSLGGLVFELEGGCDPSLLRVA
jgi:hypothetical protein